jgi:hypothetical protein
METLKLDHYFLVPSIITSLFGNRAVSTPVTPLIEDWALECDIILQSHYQKSTLITLDLLK